MTESVSTTNASSTSSDEAIFERLSDSHGSSLLPTDEQEELRRLLLDFLGRRAPESQVRASMDRDDGIDEIAWRGLVQELGLGALAVPEELGGAGASLSDVLVVCEELGRALTCVPWLSHVVLAQTLLTRLPSADAVDSLLSRLARAEARATVAFAEPGDVWDETGINMKAESSSDGAWLLTGSKAYVLDGHTADVILIVARTAAGLAILSVEAQAPGLSRSVMPTLDLTRKQAELTFVSVPATLLAEHTAARDAFSYMLDFAAAAVAAECVGGSQFVLESSVDYAKTRVQFGQAIGTFQAIKHKCADMLIAVESARSAFWNARAACSLDDDPNIFALGASIAKSTCGEAYLYCASENIQIHGGIGFTWEHSAHLYFKRARANSLMFGSSRDHRERVADLLKL